MSEEAKDTIKRAMDKMLLEPADGRCDVRHFFEKVVRESVNLNVLFYPEVAFGYWWHLVNIGAIVPVGDIERTPGLPQFDAFILTERGRRLLERGEQSPHDPPRYIGAVRKRVAEPDDIALGYLDEAVGTWRDQHHRASAVMLGCACERLVLLLAEHIADAGIKSWSEKVRKALGGAPVRASQLFDLIRDSLMQLAGERRLPGSLADALDRKLTPIFEYARGLRNKSGHPTGMKVSPDEAEAGLLLFPGFYEFVDALCKHLSAMGKKV